MSVAPPHPTPPTRNVPRRVPAIEELAALGWQINAKQYRTVHLAARYDDELEWFREGLKSPVAGICTHLQIHANTAREWIRVGHTLRHLPLIDAAFANNTISYAKVRILTRWADNDNEAELLDLAKDRTANRLTTAIAKAVALDQTDDDRDKRHRQDTELTSYVNGDGMTIIRIALPPAIAKPVLVSVDELVRQIAQTPVDTDADQDTSQQYDLATQKEPGTTTSGQNTPADTCGQHCVTTESVGITNNGQNTPADTSNRHCFAAPPLADTLRELRQRWQSGADDDWYFPTLAQQRADAFAALFLRLDIDLTAEVVIHVRGDGNTFDDGTPITTNAIARQLDNRFGRDSFVRFMIHDSQRRPIDATNKRRFPTSRQKRVVLETHNHECVDCGTTDLLEFDHNPSFQQTGHTVTNELELRCAPCHRARHRQVDALAA